jgi:hypothetical protein
MSVPLVQPITRHAIALEAVVVVLTGDPGLVLLGLRLRVQFGVKGESSI